MWLENMDERNLKEEQNVLSMVREDLEKTSEFLGKR